MLEKNLKSAINAQKSAEKRAKQSKTLHTNAAILRGAEPAEQRKKAPVLWDELKKMGTKPERPPVPDGPSATAEPSKAPNKKKPKKEVNPQPEKPVAEIISAAETPANSSMDTLGKGTDPSKKAPKKVRTKWRCTQKIKSEATPQKHPKIALLDLTGVMLRIPKPFFGAVSRPGQSRIPGGSGAWGQAPMGAQRNGIFVTRHVIKRRFPIGQPAVG